MYQERFAWMYSRWACPLAIELIELIINLIHKSTLIFILSNLELNSKYFGIMIDLMEYQY